MKTELKPCPFCGSTDLYVVQARIEEYHSVEPEISCKKCHYTIKLKELAIAIDESPETNAAWWDRGAAKKWNTRPAEDALKAEVEELRYIVEQFSKWTAEGGCVKANYPDFPCWWERNRLELELDDYCDDDDEREHKCWVEYYRWKFRQETKAATPEKGGEDE